jgi:lipopolysaccharide/colanic/teichoic acid biosynthesis glycosyltransferase
MFDRTAALLGLFLSWPLWLLVSLAILLEDGSPVFFRQTRMGQNGKAFQLLKFRSMLSKHRGTRITSANDMRFTRVGRLLRRYKVDELPQLWNVLRGDMSLVGPRPELPDFVDLSAPAWQVVLSAKPGITDLATLIYRNEEQLLATSSEPERYYCEVLLPDKLSLSRQFLETSNFYIELELIGWSAICSFFPRCFDADRIRQHFLKPAINQTRQRIGSQTF